MKTIVYQNRDEVESLKKIVDNNRQISDLLMENMKICRDFYRRNNGKELNKIYRKENLINLPATPISRTGDISSYYKWNFTIKNYQLRKNLSCLMQYDEYLNNQKSLFNIYGTVEKIMLFYMQCNLVIVVEALVRTIADRYSDNCKVCQKRKQCKKLLNKNYRNGNLYKLIEKLQEFNILTLNIEEMKILDEAIKLRNKLHIRDMVVTASCNWDITEQHYNKIKECLVKINDSLINFDKRDSRCECKNNQ